MEKLKKTVITVLVAALCIFAFAGCTEKHERGPLKVTKVTYLVYSGDQPDVELYIITKDLKVKQYNIRPEAGKNYDYLAGELPPEDCYEVTEFEIEESRWESMVNVLTRVNFMELLEEFPWDGSDDAPTYYIRVETEDAVHTSGGCNAGFKKDPESRRFSEAKQQVNHALNKSWQD
jgi:hypothetical protein